MDNENQNSPFVGTPRAGETLSEQENLDEGRDWRLGLSDSIRDAEEFNGIKSVEELANNFIAAKRFAVTGDLTPKTPEEEDAFFAKIGRPADAKGYTFALPEEIAKNEDVKALFEVLKKSAFAGNITDSQFTRQMNAFISAAKEAEETENKAVFARRQQVMDEYAAKCGENFKPKMNDLNTICRSVGDEFVEHLIKMGAGHDPVVIEGLLKLGSGYVEKEGGLYRTDGGRVLTNGEIDKEIAKIKADKAYTDGQDPRHKSAVDRMTALMKMKFPD
ncbi:MAG: hypothetical protein IJY17_07290 [Alphaproteobacteria bacterium]|nr:hypothetical protein [Alphaproteobacteria bacterium]